MMAAEYENDDIAALFSALDVLPSIQTEALLQRAQSIAFVGKGSSGKSTIAIGFAVLAATSGLRVLLVDADVQNRSVAEWSLLRQRTQNTLLQRLGPNALRPRVDVAVMSMRGDVLRPFTTRTSKGVQATDYDLVLLDFAGARSDLRTRWLSRSDLAFLPLEPTAICALATRRILVDCRSLGCNPIAFINKASRGPRASEAMEAFANAQVTFAPAVRNYVAHQDALSAGLSVVETYPQHQASDDLRKLYAWYRDRTRAEPKLWTSENPQACNRMEAIHD